MPITPDPLPIVLAFAVGFLMGHAVQGHWRHATWRLRWELTKRIPRRCPVCGVWRATGDMQHAEHKTAGWVLICQDCYDKQYHPFGKETS